MTTQKLPAGDFRTEQRAGKETALEIAPGVKYVFRIDILRLIGPGFGIVGVTAYRRNTAQSVVVM